MNYEEFYVSMQPQEKTLKERLASLQKLSKAACKESESGDVRGLARDLKAMADAAASVSAVLEQMQDTVFGFNTREYFENGEFAQEMLAQCAEKGIDVRGEFPVYEMFPYRVKLDAENQDIYLDRKKVQCMRPQSFVNLVKSGQEKLNRAPFNAGTFVNELAEAYDLALLKLNKKEGADIYLTRLYKFLAPMGRFRRDYDQQSFAFDLARLYLSGVEETKNGRRFQFGPSRDQSKAIRILDNDGKEQYLATIRFFS